jgi:hypothetical protein
MNKLFFAIQVLYAFFDTLQDANSEIKRVLRKMRGLLNASFPWKKEPGLKCI